jgi:prolyl-tRNA synthetase
VLSKENELRWPTAIAPFSVCLIGPKRGSREAAAASGLLDQLINQLTAGRHDDVIVDDRDKFTVGRRLQDARRIGYPYVVLLGKRSADTGRPLVELHCVNEDSVEELSPADLIQCLQAKLS